ncbi:MAG: SDR family NAD(P)-dependent oxidoreductase [Candidatus Eisenbacteria bacterium]|nr:SDR family NAD(P)-dependent oxidoreductase [Candidatus Eisenbacteria bacterium]
MSWSGKHVLVTGAGGFIGSHLTGLLADDGASVRAFIHYNSRNDRGNLEFLADEQMARVEVVMGNVEDAGSVDEAVRGTDCVFHLAALIGIPYSYVAPRSYVATNVSGTLNVLEAVRRNDVPRMVHTSTSEAYGTALYVPIDEKHPLQGQSPYSATKIGADKLAESYHRSFGTPVATIRPFNTFGPRQSARAVIPTIITQLLSGDDVVRLGSLTPKRDLTYVEDTARGFMAVAECDEALGEVTNVGRGSAVTIGELAEMLVEMVNPDARIESVDERVRPDRSEVMELVCGNARAKEILGWEPAVSLEEGLARTVDFIREHMDLYRPDEYTV